MKKIPSLFKRNYDGDRLVRNEVVEGCEWVLAGEGVATEKFDGTACMVKDGVLYKRYDRKRNKKGQYRSAPEGWIPCEPEPDAKSGHWPGWLVVDVDDPADKWHAAAHDCALENGTYELVGPEVQGNPYRLHRNELWRHGVPFRSRDPRTFLDIKASLAAMPTVEGIVWHHPDGRMAKIKRKDFGMEWPP